MQKIDRIENETDNLVTTVYRTHMTYTVQFSNYDASRPYAVVASRSFNRVVGRYATKEQAARRARDLTKRDAR